MWLGTPLDQAGFVGNFSLCGHRLVLELPGLPAGPRLLSSFENQCAFQCPHYLRFTRIDHQHLSHAPHGPDIGTQEVLLASIADLVHQFDANQLFRMGKHSIGSELLTGKLETYVPEWPNCTRHQCERRGQASRHCVFPTVHSSLQLPTMEKSIPTGELHIRLAYFMIEISLLVMGSCVLLEFAKKALTDWTLRRVRSCRQRRSQPADQQFEIRAIECQAQVLIVAFALWCSACQCLMYMLMDAMVMCGAVNLVTGPAWEF